MTLALPPCSFSQLTYQLLNWANAPGVVGITLSRLESAKEACVVHLRYCEPMGSGGDLCFWVAAATQVRLVSEGAILPGPITSDAWIPHGPCSSVFQYAGILSAERLNIYLGEWVHARSLFDELSKHPSMVNGDEQCLGFIKNLLARSRDIALLLHTAKVHGSPSPSLPKKHSALPSSPAEHDDDHHA